MSRLFSTVDWGVNANIYEVNIRQYTKEGTFHAFGKHLPRLKAMGIKILWLMPVTPISKKERQGTLGSYYACSSYVQVNPEYGTMDDLKALVKQAHELGMKLIIDWVANHTGWDHHWTKEHPDWYKKDAKGNFTEVNGWKDVIDLDYSKPELRKAMVNAMQHWVNDAGIDGFRCDMAHLVPLDFWKDARTQCEQHQPLFWLGECEEVSYHDVFDTTYAWEWMHVTERLGKGTASVNDVYNVLHKYSQYPVGSQKLFFTANHDENSWNGTEYEKYGGAAKALAVFTASWQGMPMVYSGQESPSKKRLQFFDKDLVEWNNPLQLKEFYQTILLLHQSKAVAGGETFILPTGNNSVMAYLRKKDEEIVLVLLNFSDAEKVVVTIEHDWLKGSFHNIFSGMNYTFTPKELFELQAFEYFVYKSHV